VRNERYVECSLPVQLSQLSFIALDVEDTNNLGSTAAAVTLIQQAVSAVNGLQPPLRPVIYTDRGQWNHITGSASAFADVLWLAGNQPTMTLKPSFDGWTTSMLLGKQYKPDVAPFAGVSEVDLDIFNAALFQ
jgi:hypothetical protein